MNPNGFEVGFRAGEPTTYLIATPNFTFDAGFRAGEPPVSLTLPITNFVAPSGGAGGGSLGYGYSYRYAP
jgi:hypothetical protein